ncbi:hypothetical protein BDU57DRAFT_532143 [Ampelomyces quisqualis]|uniref:Uncharacterized protein n=1 Tax=Ampelomyces quisqualis TaxID=50730 RepID=A0A6A5QG07_AMPQU|nr:hypothetical protein BDU57DRAFT_532143 [Ampelomyces quisqualis]
MHRNDFSRSHGPGRFRNGDLNQEMLFAEIIANRQKHGSSSGHHSVFGGIGGHGPPFLGRHPPPSLGGHGMSLMMGGFSRHRMPPPIGMVPSGPGMGMSMGLGIGRSSQIPIGLGMGIDLGIGPGRPQFAHSPHARPQHSPFGYHSPGPPRAQPLLLPQHIHSQSPFSRTRRTPFPSSTMSLFDDYNDDSEDEYRMMPPFRHTRGRRMMGGRRIAPRYAQRRRGYGLNRLEDSEDEFDEFDDYHDFQEEDEFDMYGTRQSPFTRWRGGY